jgi:hypothetical protein
MLLLKISKNLTTILHAERNMTDMMNVTAEKIEIKSSHQITNLSKTRRRRDVKKSSVDIMKRKNIMSTNTLLQL